MKLKVLVIGDVIIDTPDDITTEIFCCKIYTDAIQIKLSNKHGERTIDSKNIIWELDSEGDLISLTVYNQSPEVINHALNELNC